MGLFWGSLFSKGFVIGWDFAFQNGLGYNGQQQLTLTIQGLISGRAHYQKNVCLRFGGLIFRRAFFFGRGGGGAGYQILWYLCKPFFPCRPWNT